MLLISYHILYIFLYICFSFSFMFMPANTTEVDTRENCMYPKVPSLLSIYMYPKVPSLLSIYVPKGTITARDSDLYLYALEGTITIRDSDLCMTQTGLL